MGQLMNHMLTVNTIFNQPHWDWNKSSCCFCCCHIYFIINVKTWGWTCIDPTGSIKFWSYLTTGENVLEQSWLQFHNLAVWISVWKSKTQHVINFYCQIRTRLHFWTVFKWSNFYKTGSAPVFSGSPITTYLMGLMIQNQLQVHCVQKMV